MWPALRSTTCVSRLCCFQYPTTTCSPFPAPALPSHAPLQAAPTSSSAALLPLADHLALSSMSMCRPAPCHCAMSRLWESEASRSILKQASWLST